jgi:hypothetical protein
MDATAAIFVHMQSAFMLNHETAVQRRDATGAETSNSIWNLFIFKQKMTSVRVIYQSRVQFAIDVPTFG